MEASQFVEGVDASDAAHRWRGMVRGNNSKKLSEGSAKLIETRYIYFSTQPITMIKCYLFLGALLLSRLGYAQDSLTHRHRIMAQLGPAKFISQDEAVSPLRYRGTALGYYLGYQFKGQKNQHKINLAFAPPVLEPNTAVFNDKYQPLQVLYSQLTYAYQRVGWQRQDFRIHWGGQWNNTVFLRSRNFGNTTASGDIFSSLNVMLALCYSPTVKHQVSWTLGYPLVALTVERPYGFAFGDVSNDWEAISDIPQQSEWMTIHQFIDIQSTIAYEYSFDPRWSFLASYAFRYIQYSNELPAKSAIHSLQAGVSFGL